MTFNQALYVKWLRIRCNGSWRWVAAKFDERYIHEKPYNDESVLSGNQLDGIKLCNKAMSILSENIDDGWN